MQKRHVMYRRVWGGARQLGRGIGLHRGRAFDVPGIVDEQTHRLLQQLRDIRTAGHGPSDATRVTNAVDGGQQTPVDGVVCNNEHR